MSDGFDTGYRLGGNGEAGRRRVEEGMLACTHQKNSPLVGGLQLAVYSKGGVGVDAVSTGEY
jgi:hypothetical protein